MYPIPNWPYQSPKWTERARLGLLDVGTETRDATKSTLEEILGRSEAFPVDFPIDAPRCKALKSQVEPQILNRNVSSAYPILHENALPLYADFILHKRKFGSASERDLYENMSILQLVNRLLTKRAVAFVGRNDDYILLNGTSGRGQWETVGTDGQGENLNLSHCLSYDEIKLSSFLSVSSFTYFINDGSRNNSGNVARNRSNIQEEGVIIGLIGARMEKKGFMEYQEVVYTQQQNTEGNGYGLLFVPTLQSLFSAFYEKPCQTYRDFLNGKNIHQPGYCNEISKGVYFDNVTYAKRIALSIDTLLFEGNSRAKEHGTTAFVHVVGIGLGVWKCSVHQEEVFMQTFAKRLEVLGEHLPSVSDVYFAYFRESSCGKYRHESAVKIGDHPKGGIKILLGERQPHQKLTGENEGKLLVVSYAWDGNALPGNEFWNGNLTSSGDAAAAASTQISELHNPHINPAVSAGNLRIATSNGVISFGAYVQSVISGSEERKLLEGEFSMPE